MLSGLMRKSGSWGQEQHFSFPSNQSIKERRSLSGARERRSQKCERERERRSEKNLRARARAALGKIRERLATSGALQISENDLSKCSIHLNFDLLLMLELNKKSTMQCVF